MIAFEFDDHEDACTFRSLCKELRDASDDAFLAIHSTFPITISALGYRRLSGAICCPKLPQKVRTLVILATPPAVPALPINNPRITLKMFSVCFNAFTNCTSICFRHDPYNAALAALAGRIERRVMAVLNAAFASTMPARSIDLAGTPLIIPELHIAMSGRYLQGGAYSRVITKLRLDLRLQLPETQSGGTDSQLLQVVSGLGRSHRA